MSDVQELTKPVEQLTQPGDHDKMSHYMRKTDILEGAIEGKARWTLCGILLVPIRDPKFPVCPECKEIYEAKRP